jgi:hypothetical protein
MRTTALVIAVLSVCFLGFWTDTASAQGATRTWVSGVGDDANPCSRTAPCKTFAGAISKTAPGGEIDALDPGGFGTVTITKAITLDGGGGQVASILSSGVNGIVVSAQPGDVVILRNLRINGAGTTLGVNGIRFLSGGALHVENCDIFGFSNDGIDIFPSNASQVFIKGTTLNNTNGGVQVRSNGSGNVSAALEGVLMNGNSAFGLKADGSGGSGAIHVSMSNSQASANANNGVNAVSGPGAVNVLINRSAIVNNGTNGLQANAVNGSTARIQVGSSSLTGNNVAANPVNGGLVQTYQNNEVAGNLSVDGTFSGPIGPQ